MKTPACKLFQEQSRKLLKSLVPLHEPGDTTDPGPAPGCFAGQDRSHQ